MLVAAMATGMVAGCGSSSDSKSDKKDAKGKVYYLNFKPEQDEQWQDLAKEYTKETGVDVTVPVSYTHLDVYKRQRCW